MKLLSREKKMCVSRKLRRRYVYGVLPSLLFMMVNDEIFARAILDKYERYMSLG